MKLGVVRPCSFSVVPAAHEAALHLLDWRRDVVSELDWILSPSSGTIDEMREAMCQKALSDGCDMVLMLDCDVVPYPSAFSELLDQLLVGGADLASALCFRRFPPFVPVCWDKDGRQLWPFKDFRFGDVIESCQAGCGMLLVKREVFEAIERPWFAFVDRIESDIVRHMSEDVFFTRRATEAGYKLVTVTNERYDCGHLTYLEVDRHAWILFHAINRLGWDGLIELITQQKEE